MRKNVTGVVVDVNEDVLVEQDTAKVVKSPRTRAALKRQLIEADYELANGLDDYLWLQSIHDGEVVTCVKLA